MHKILIVMTLIAVLAITAFPAFAQGETNSRTVTLTEEDINESYRVTNNPRRSVSDVVVDLQSDQVVISATITFPRQDPLATVTTLTANLTNGRVFWTVESVTVDGEPVSEELLTQINAAITTAWRNYIKREFGSGRITALDITEDSLSYTITPLRARSR